MKIIILLLLTSCGMSKDTWTCVDGWLYAKTGYTKVGVFKHDHQHFLRTNQRCDQNTIDQLKLHDLQQSLQRPIPHQQNSTNI